MLLFVTKQQKRAKISQDFAFFLQKSTRAWKKSTLPLVVAVVTNLSYVNKHLIQRKVTHWLPEIYSWSTIPFSGLDIIQSTNLTFPHQNWFVNLSKIFWKLNILPCHFEKENTKIHLDALFSLFSPTSVLLGCYFLLETAPTWAGLCLQTA